MTKYILAIILSIILVLFFSSFNPEKAPEFSRLVEIEPESQIAVATIPEIAELEIKPFFTKPSPMYEVIKIVDGDTIDVKIDGKVERLRLIGINTPETVDPRKPVECFGREASARVSELLTGKSVMLESDLLQGERDKYSRLLRYVFLEDGISFNLKMIEDGYAYEYTYDGQYKYQAEFKAAQKYAKANLLGLWGDICLGETSFKTLPANDAPNSCNIKGNINASKERIYHIPGCGSYEKTVIDESAGEKWFCSEEDALNTGWRKARNC